MLNMLMRRKIAARHCSRDAQMYKFTMEQWEIVLGMEREDGKEMAGELRRVLLVCQVSNGGGIGRLGCEEGF